MSRLVNRPAITPGTLPPFPGLSATECSVGGRVLIEALANRMAVEDAVATTHVSARDAATCAAAVAFSILGQLEDFLSTLPPEPSLTLSRPATRTVG